MEELSEEQLARLRQNKALALERKRKRDAELEEASKKAELVCEVCSEREQPLVTKLQEGYGVNVCAECRDKTDDYDVLSKSDVLTEYLLPEDLLKFLPHTTRENPHKSNWAPMKMYLRKMVREKSYERWEDDKGLQAEKARRQTLKYDRDLEKSIKSLEEKVGEGDEASLVLAKMLSSGVSSSAASSSSSKPKKSGNLKGKMGGMLRAIVGSDDA
jgi:DNA repair protein